MPRVFSKLHPPTRGDPAEFELFTPLRLDDELELKNRIVFAPLTRGRADLNRVPTENNQLYYEQRSNAGLIITEGTGISEQGYGWYRAAAMYTQAHADGWKKVVDRVHAKGGRIFLQLWHMGRQGHSSFNSKGELVSASALRLESGHTRTAEYVQAPYETPRALDASEIPGIVDDYKHAATLAKQVGFDGVEVHAANGYLLDQFLQSATNKRTDQYGGSFENRARFLLEVVQGLKTVFPSTRIGVRLSPNGAFAGMGSEDNYELFTYVMERLGREQLAYLAVLDGFGFGRHDKGRIVSAQDAKRAFKGHVMANCSYTRDIAEGAVRSGSADLVSFGRPFMSNPDLAERFRHSWPLAPEPSYEVYYRGDAVGYCDFPAYTPPNETAAAEATA